MNDPIYPLSSDTDIVNNVTYDEIAIGDSASLLRKLSPADIQAFATVSGDVNPAHLDQDYAEHTMFHGVIAHGMWGGALISALLGTRLPGPGTIYLEQSLQFLKPVRVGDELTVTVTVLAKDDEKKRLRLHCEIKNQKGQPVVTGEAHVIAPSERVSRPRAHLPTIAMFDLGARQQALIHSVAELEPVSCAVVHPCEAEALKGALEAGQQGLIKPVLIAPKQKLLAIASQAGLDLSSATIIDVPHSHAAAARAVELAASGEIESLMKGSLHTDELMSAVLSNPALRTKRRLSHVFHLDVPMYHKVLLLTDAALNLAPDLAEKADILQNAIELAQILGIVEPKVALLAAVENVNPRMPATLDAAALCKMAERGQIKGALLDGPLAFDNAISSRAAEIKGIDSPVAGDPDILLAPNLEAANMMAKQFEYSAGAAAAGIVLGARVPIALTSRADEAATRVASAALLKLVAHAYRRNTP